MKKMQSINLIFKIIFLSGCLSLSKAYAEMDQTTVREETEDLINEEAFEPVTPLGPEKGQRNGFASMNLGVKTMIYQSWHPIFNISTEYGVILGKSPLFDDGVVEGVVSLNFAYASKGTALKIATNIELNFIKNVV